MACELCGEVATLYYLDDLEICWLCRIAIDKWEDANDDAIFTDEDKEDLKDYR